MIDPEDQLFEEAYLSEHDRANCEGDCCFCGTCACLTPEQRAAALCICGCDIPACELCLEDGCSSEPLEPQG